MPVLGSGAAGNSAVPAAQLAASARDQQCSANPDCVVVGLINNMPDSALQSTERQFIELLDAASADIPVRLRLFSLPDVPRSQSTRKYMSSDYCSLAELRCSRIDGLIVTGTEPRAPCLKDEPYWTSLTDVLEWARENTASTIWSCLAAHAAVLHMDGIARHLLRGKRFGLFECTSVSTHPLIAGLPSRMQIAHSRWNELREEELRACSYTLLTRSRQAGADTFIKQQRKSLFVFFQGHPEYDSRALFKEYRRDIGRFLRGERQDYPSMPEGYFNALASDPIASFQRRAVRERHASLLNRFPTSLLEGLIAPVPRTPVVHMYANWLAYVRAQRSQTSTLKPSRARRIHARSMQGRLHKGSVDRIPAEGAEMDMLLKTRSEEQSPQPRRSVSPLERSGFSKTWTFFDGDWHAGNVAILGARSHAAWLGSIVFDGARAFEGVMPDLDLHCARVNNSAAAFHLQASVTVNEWIGLTVDGLKRFDAHAELYIRPMYWAETGSPGGIRHDPDSTRWCLCIYEAPIPKPAGAAITLSPFRRPTAECAPVEAKAGCLYPNNARALVDGAAARLRQLSDARHAGQRGRAWHRKRVHGKGRRGLYASRQRHFSQRDHPSARHSPVARRRDHSRRKKYELRRVSGGR